MIDQLEIDNSNVKLTKNNIGAPKIQNNFWYTIKLLILLTIHSRYTVNTKAKRRY